MEYFLSLEGVPGYDGKLRDLCSRPINNPYSNGGKIHWASICAELGAVTLLGRDLALEIVGFDRSSPRRAKGTNKNCDIECRGSGPELLFEVRRRAKQDSFDLPDALDEFLAALDLPYSLTPELQERPYKCSPGSKLRDHLDRFERTKVGAPWRANRRPPPFSTEGVLFIFHEKSRLKTGGRHYGDPVSAEDIEAWLFNDIQIGRDGTQMQPMIVAAEKKGADWLACRVPDWGGLDEIVEHCFRRLERVGQRSFTAGDSRLRDLAGVILFARYDVFAIVNRAGSDPARRLVA